MGFTRDEHIAEAERLAVVIDDILQNPKSEREDILVAGVFARIGRFHLALSQVGEEAEQQWHHPGSEPRGHPVSECEIRGCLL